MALAFRNRENNVLDESAFKVTTDLLDRNPENYTVWNMRREILTNLFKEKSPEEQKKLILGDLYFVQSKFKSFPKVYWLWNHRRWCLELDPTADWKQELELVNYLLEKDSRNFHGWHYRRFVIQKLEQATSTSLTTEEFKYTTKKINENFSNYSAWHNRTKLLPAYLETAEASDRRTTIYSELEYAIQAIYTDPDDQSAWLYHQWLLIETKELVPDMTTEEFFDLVSKQIDSIGELYEVEPDSSNCMFFLVKYLIHCKKITGKSPKTSFSAEDLLNKLQQTDAMRKNMYKYYESFIL